MKTHTSRCICAAMLMALPSIASAGPKFAVWLDGDLSTGGNPIPTQLNTIGSATLVTTAQLETPGFLNSFDAVVVSRYDASFGSYLSSAAAANILAYVGGPGPAQGGVAVFSNDMSDNLGSGYDPFDPNLQQLFLNAATYAAASHHGFIGEFNGAVMAMTANSVGVPAIGLLSGSAGPVHGYGLQFTYGVGPIGSGNPIDTGVVFPFTDTDGSTFLTTITGADPGNIVDVYTSSGIDGVPAVLANNFVIHGGQVPDAADSLLLLALSVSGIICCRWTASRSLLRF